MRQKRGLSLISLSHHLHLSIEKKTFSHISHLSSILLSLALCSAQCIPFDEKKSFRAGWPQQPDLQPSTAVQHMQHGTCLLPWPWAVLWLFDDSDKPKNSLLRRGREACGLVVWRGTEKRQWQAEEKKKKRHAFLGGHCLSGILSMACMVGWSVHGQT